MAEDFVIQNIPTPIVTEATWGGQDNSYIIANIDGQQVFVPNDMSNRHRVAIAKWVEAGHTIADPVPPAPVVPDVITDRQFFQQLAIDGIITQDEAVAAVATGTIPSAMQTLVNQLPSNEQFAAKMLISGNVEFHRNAPVTLSIATLYGWTAEQVDSLWQAAAAL